MDIEYNNLDDEWINEFEKRNNLYINLRVIYVNT
jgi:hypothetical protein